MIDGQAATTSWTAWNKLSLQNVDNTQQLQKEEGQMQAESGWQYTLALRPQARLDPVAHLVWYKV